MDALTIAVDAVTYFMQPECLTPIRRTPSALCVHWDIEQGEDEPANFAHTGPCRS